MDGHDLLAARQGPDIAGAVQPGIAKTAWQFQLLPRGAPEPTGRRGMQRRGQVVVGNTVGRRDHPDRTEWVQTVIRLAPAQRPQQFMGDPVNAGQRTRQEPPVDDELRR